MIVLLVACGSPEPRFLEVTGFDGAELAADGLWVQDALTRDGAVVETLHGFMLGGAPLQCEDLLAADSEAVQDATNRPITDRASCEAVRTAWRIRGGHPLARTGLNLDFALWGAEGDGGPGISPVPGRIEPLDGPDGDPVEYALFASRVHENWPLQVSLHLDCDAAGSGGDPWASIPDDETDRDYQPSGPMTFLAPTDDHVDVELDLDLVGNGAPGGTIRGDARLHVCGTSRALD